MKNTFYLKLIAPLLFLYACGTEIRKGSSEPSIEISKDSITVNLTQLWDTDSSQLITPECASFDREGNILYVSNLNTSNDVDNDGFISLVNIDGTIGNARWVEGLKAPLGNEIYDGHLYVNDATAVVKIDIKTGNIVERINIEGAKSLNGIDIDEDGNIYSADTQGNKIFKITQDGEVAVILESEDLDRPNGVLINGKALIVASFNGGKLLSIDLDNKAISTLAEGIERADGIILLEGGHYLVSGWSGQIHFISNDLKVQKILDTQKEKINAADMAYIPEENLLVVPTFNDNRLIGYKLSINN